MSKFKVGDRVAWDGNWPASEYAIDEIFGNNAMISWGHDDESYCTSVPLSELTLIASAPTHTRLFFALPCKM